MITEASLKVYERYAGDIDGWARVNDQTEMKCITDDIWLEIDCLRMELSALANGQVSTEYEKEIKNKLKEKTDNFETAQKLIEMIQRLQKRKGV